MRLPTITEGEPSGSSPGVQPGVALVNTDLSRAVHGVGFETLMPDDFGNISLRAAIDAQKMSLLNL